LTIPALALAAVTRNLPQFASTGLICVVVGYLLTFDLARPWIRPDTVRLNATLLLIAPGAFAAIALQYSRRRIRLARAIALSAFAGAVLLAAYVPKRYTTAVGCRGGPAVAIALSQHTHPAIERLKSPRYGIVTAGIPVALSGTSPEAIVQLSPLTLDVVNQRGDRWSMPDLSFRPGRQPPPRPAIYPWVFVPEKERVGWLVLSIDDKLINAITAQPVRLNGSFAANVALLGSVREAFLQTYGLSVPGVGRCANFTIQNLPSFYQNDMIKAVCESPDDSPRARVELVHLPTGRRVRQALGDASSHVGYPTHTWLSPVHRRNTFFQIAETQVLQEGSRWLVMRSELPDSRLEFMPLIDAGCSIVQVDLLNIDLRQYILEMSRERLPR
jgi:hypothetical protein